MIEYLPAALVLFFAMVVVWVIAKHVVQKAGALILNSVAGVLMLLALNAFLGWRIPVNLTTLLACALFGLPAVGVLVVLYLSGMI